MSPRFRHRRAVAVIAVAGILDVLLGFAFAAADHIGTWDGLYFSVTTATTVGYGDVTPHGWAAHLIAVVIMVTVIPLFGAAFSLFTSGLSAVRLHRAARHAEAARQIAADLYASQTGSAHPLAGP